MTAAQITPIRAEIDRDWRGRPLVVPPEGGPVVPYTRATTFVSAVDDEFGLIKWKQRMTALGLAAREDLLMAVIGARAPQGADELTTRKANRAVDAVVREAFVAAGGDSAATLGTALHGITERVDRGEEVGPIPAKFESSLAAYVEATSALKAVHVEAFCVQDKLQVGGTPDRVVEYQGKRYIADLKTGTINLGHLKIAAQLAMYARSRVYDVPTHERSTHGAEIDRGIVIHLPQTDELRGTCHLYWIDLLVGWEAVLLAARVREARQRNFASITAPFGETFTPQANLIEARDNKPVGPAPLQASKSDEQQPSAPTIRSAADFVAAAIAAATTADDVRALWTPDWTPEQVALAAARVAELSKE